MRTPVIAGNWKMYLTPQRAFDLIDDLLPQIQNVKDVEVIVCPANPVLGMMAEKLSGTGIQMGGQNLYPKEEGAFTGENAPNMLKAVGCEYCILGHSERRQYFNETDEFINEKVKAAIQFELTPIICCGESLEQRENGDTLTVVGTQIKKAFQDVSAEDAENIIVAYEPIWAIGTGKTATPEMAQDVHAGIRSILENIYGIEVADKIRIQYGGSVKPDNVDALMAQPDIDGALVGGASLKADSFARLVNFEK